MSHKEFERYLTNLYKMFCIGRGIVVFARHKYTFEKEYEYFEIIISDDNGEMQIDWDYHEGEQEYIIDGWNYLSDLLDKAHSRGTYYTFGG